MTTEVPLPDQLFHYTRQEGLLGILGTKEMWASKIQYLNDHTEFSLTFNLLRESSRRRLAIETDELRVRWLNKLLQDAERVEEVHVFVCCFSESSDLLSQWRAYCSPGDGYSIGFRAEVLRQIAAAIGWRLVQCSYNSEVQRKNVEDLIDGQLSDYVTNTGRSSQTDQALEQHVWRTLQGFVQLAPTAKHPAFFEEKEWRLVSPTIPTDDPNFDFRPGRSSLVPHYRLPLTSKEQPLEFGTVVIGPTPNPRLSLVALSNILSARRVRGWTTSNSQVPFRGW